MMPAIGKQEPLLAARAVMREDNYWRRQTAIVWGQSTCGSASRSCKAHGTAAMCGDARLTPRDRDSLVTITPRRDETCGHHASVQVYGDTGHAGALKC